MQEKIRMEIDQPFPNARSPQLRLQLAACELTLRPGEGTAWVTGTYDDLDGSLPLQIQQTVPTLNITQRETLAEALRLETRLASLDLTLGKSRPFDLAIEAGLQESHVDLTRLPLTRLNVRHSQGKLELRFGEPNPQPMDTFDLLVSAGRLEARGLANANFTRLKVEGGEADCLFDFSGELQRPAQGNIIIPQGSVEIYVPPTTAVRIALESLTRVVEVGTGFTKRAGAFWNQAALASQSPVLTLKVSVLVGTVRLHRL